MEISEVVNLNRIWLLLYGIFSGTFAFLLCELVKLLADRFSPFIFKMRNRKKNENKEKRGDKI